METHPGEGVVKEKLTPGNSFTRGSAGSSGISEGNITGRGKNK